MINRKHIIAGFGNALLDICVPINNNTLLNKFNLAPDGQKEVNENILRALLESVNRNENSVTFCAGGATQNTFRTIQHLVKVPQFTIFFGGCGKDKEADILLEKVKSSGVDTRYAVHERKPTGTVISLINDKNRSLVAHIGAAGVYTLQDLQQGDNIEVIKNVYIMYIEGFFVSHSFDVALKVVSLCRQNGIIFVFNISGAYLTARYSLELATMVALADIVIGNKNEYLELAKYLKIQDTSIENILSLMKSLDYKNYISNKDDFPQRTNYKLEQMSNVEKIAIWTDGDNPVHAVYKNSEFVTFNVPHLKSSLIKDTTGAGDAFAAGVIVGFIMNKSLIECLELGCKTARQVIQSVGCTFPENSETLVHIDL